MITAWNAVVLWVLAFVGLILCGVVAVVMVIVLVLSDAIKRNRAGRLGP